MQSLHDDPPTKEQAMERHSSHAFTARKSDAREQLISGQDVTTALELLMELRELTLSRRHLKEANTLIVKLGGAAQLCPDRSIVEPD